MVTQASGSLQISEWLGLDPDFEAVRLNIDAPTQSGRSGGKAASATRPRVGTSIDSVVSPAVSSKGREPAKLVCVRVVTRLARARSAPAERTTTSSLEKPSRRSMVICGI